MCRNGHHTTSSAEISPELRSKFCPECGEATFTNCRHCNNRIRGHYYVPGFIGFSKWTPPNYCHGCGKPYPWTEQRLASASEMADEIEELSPQEREQLKRSISDLGSDSPRTELAASRYAKLRKKMGATASSTLDKVVGVLATAAVKSTLGI